MLQKVILPKKFTIIIVYDNYRFSKSIEYVFDFIFSMYDARYKIIPHNQFRSEDYNLDKTLVINYGKESINIDRKKYIHICASDFFGKDYLRPASLPKSPLKRYNDLPIIYSGCGKIDNFVSKSDSFVKTNIDIVASIFFMITRYEEFVSGKEDKNNRFLATASLAYKENFLDRPIVDEYVDLLLHWLDFLNLELKHKKFWGDQDFAICLTHDIDAIRKYKWYPPLRSIFSLLLKHREIKKALVNVLDYAKAKVIKDPYDTFNYLMDLEDKYGFKSSFYFLGVNTKKDKGFFLNSSHFFLLAKNIKKRNFEIGLHPGFNSYNNLRIMKKEKEMLERIIRDKVFGVRQHFLRWKNPETWRIQERIGFIYDTTLGFPDYSGFRCGTCFPFQPFDILENRKLNIWELPLVVMDRTLQSPAYQNFSSHKAKKEMMKLIKIVKKFGGVFVILWHNSSFDAVDGWSGWEKVYEDLIKYISKQNSYVGSGRDIIRKINGSVD